MTEQRPMNRLEQVRYLASQLQQCHDTIINPTEKTKIAKLLTELRSVEDQMLVNVPFPRNSVFAPAPTPPSLSNFRVFADQNGLTQLPDIQQKAASMFPPSLVGPAVQSVMTMNDAKDRARIEAQAAHISRMSRQKLRGQTLTDSQLREEVLRDVYSEPGVVTKDVQPIADLVVQQLKYH